MIVSDYLYSEIDPFIHTAVLKHVFVCVFQFQPVQSRVGSAGEEQHSGDGSFIRAGSPLRAFCLCKKQHTMNKQKQYYMCWLTMKTIQSCCIVICGVGWFVSFQNMKTFPVHKNPFPVSSSSGFPVPFDLPPTSYSPKGTEVCVNSLYVFMYRL